MAAAWELQEFLFNDWPGLAEAAASARLAGRGAMAVLLPGVGLPILSAVLGVLSALSLLMLTRNNYWGERRGDRSAFLLLPAFGGCLWLVLTYRDMSSDPVVAGYACHLLALVAVTLALYYTVALSFGKHPRPRAALYFSLLAVYLCLTALADGLELTQTLLLLAAVLWFTNQSFVLLHNGARLPWPLPPMRPDRDDEEDGDDSPGGHEN